MSWKNDRAEMEMREEGKKMMDKAAKRKTEQERTQVGQWKITIKGSSDYTKEDVESFMDQLISFANDCDDKNPRIEVAIDPITKD